MDSNVWPTDLDEKLQKLRIYLRGLPPSLPLAFAGSHYNFLDFEPDTDWVEKCGSVKDAVNRELEVRLGTRAHGPIDLTERGPALEFLVEVLDRYIKIIPGDNTLLVEWVDDILAGAVQTYTKHAVVVSLDSFQGVISGW